MKFTWMKPVAETCVVQVKQKDGVKYAIRSATEHPLLDVQDLGNGKYRVVTQKYDYYAQFRRNDEPR